MGGMEDHNIGRIAKIMDLCDDLSHLVSLHNEVRVTEISSCMISVFQLFSNLFSNVLLSFNNCLEC